MSVQTITRTRAVLAGSAERAAVNSLIAEPEASVSGAPVFAPEAAALLLALLLLSPKEPTEPREK
ncbi:hypothetical protein ACFRMN_26630 [Streptomyces sp. NPDC056835]|uniref:hypothetical protein n=1 Tax=Streptomyces sp. NPDC056835 TaxID=3345956 RepID=UPI003696E276